MKIKVDRRLSSSQDVDIEIKEEKIMSKLKPILIGNHTYGNYNPSRGTFWYTRGTWEGGVKILDDKSLQLFSGKWLR